MTDDNLIFEARLLELPSQAPRCGDIKVAVAYRFRMTKILRAQPANKTVIVLIPCPDLLGDRFFEIETRYRIEASSDLKESGTYTIYNDYGKRRLLWCLGITRLSKGTRTRGRSVSS